MACNLSKSEKMSPQSLKGNFYKLKEIIFSAANLPIHLQNFFFLFFIFNFFNDIREERNQFVHKETLDIFVMIKR